MITIDIDLPLKVQNGGLFISRGIGLHPERVLDSWELIFVEKGVLSIREEGRDFHVRAGESLLLYPHRHHIGIETFPTDLRFYWIHFEWNHPPAEGGHVSRLSLPQYRKVHDGNYIVSLFRQFLNEQENNVRSPVLELILLLILQRLSDAFPDEDQISDGGMALAYKARQLIRTRFHQSLSTAAIAAQLHCNPDYLGRVYRKTFAMTLTQAIHRQRIGHAEKLLINDACPLREVALRCGFSDVGYFREIFRQLTGMTPSAYKRRYCKEHINSD